MALSRSPSVSTLSTARRDELQLEERLRAPWEGGSARVLEEDEDETARQRTPMVEYTEPLFQWMTLRDTSKHVYDPRSLISHGRPSVMIAGPLLCIGTEEARVLCFGYDQRLVKAIALPRQDRDKLNAVTALSISSDAKRIAVGQADGTLTFYTLANPTKPQTILPMVDEDFSQEWKETHQKGSTITDLAFLAGRSDLVVSRDHHGMVFLWLLTSILGFSGLDVRKLAGQYPARATGSTKKINAGALAIAACPLGTQAHPSDTFCMVALWLARKIVIVQTRPEIQVLGRVSVNDLCDAKSRYNLSWYPSIKSSEPVLACSNGNDIRLIQLRANGTFSFKIIGRYSLQDADIDVISFLNRETLLVLSKRQFHLLSLGDSVLAKTANDAPLTLLQYRADEQTLSWANSVSAYQGKVYTLWDSSIQVAIRSTWADNILGHVMQEDFMGAIRLAMAYHRKPGDLSFFDLPRLETARRVVLAHRIGSLIKASLDFAFDPKRLVDGTLAGDIDEGIDPSSLFLDLASISIEAATLGDSGLALMIQEVYDRFVNAGIEVIFLQTLGKAILQGTVILLPPSISQSLIQYYAQADLTHLEELLCSMEPGTLDIDMALLLCRQHGLKNAKLHVLTRALADWTSPLATLLQADSDEELFAYVGSVWNGQDYPFGREVPTLEREEAQRQILAFIFSGRFRGTPDYRMPVILKEEEPQLYPYLRRFLNLNPERFLALLDLTFELAWLDEGRSDRAEISRQSMIECLFEVNASGTISAQASIFITIFIARNVSKYPQNISCPPPMLDRLLQGLAAESAHVRLADREFAAEFVLSIYSPDWSTLEVIFKNAGFWRILSDLYRKTGRLGLLFEAMVKCAKGPSEIWEAAMQLLPRYTEMALSEQETLRSSLAMTLPALVDRIQSLADLMLQSMDKDVLEVCHLVQDEACLVLLYDHFYGKLDFSAEDKKSYFSLSVRLHPARVHEIVERMDREDMELCLDLCTDPVMDARVYILSKLVSPSEALQQGVVGLKTHLLEDEVKDSAFVKRLGTSLFKVAVQDRTWSPLLDGLIQSWSIAQQREVQTGIEETLRHTVKDILQHNTALEMDTLLHALIDGSAQHLPLTHHLLSTIRDDRALDLASVKAAHTISTQALLRQQRRNHLLRKRAHRQRPLSGTLAHLTPQAAYKSFMKRDL